MISFLFCPPVISISLYRPVYILPCGIILFVLGLAGVLNPIPFEREFIVDGILAVLSVVLLWVACIRTQSLRRPWGAVMLLSYAAYLGYLLFF